MESIQDTFHFKPEISPVVIPVNSGICLRWEHVPVLAMDAGIQAGVVLEYCPGVSPTVLPIFSPGAGLRWFFLNHAGIALRAGWAWVGAYPIWGGPTIQLGPVFR